MAESTDNSKDMMSFQVLSNFTSSLTILSNLLVDTTKLIRNNLLNINSTNHTSNTSTNTTLDHESTDIQPGNSSGTLRHARHARHARPALLTTTIPNNGIALDSACTNCAYKESDARATSLSVHTSAPADQLTIMAADGAHIQSMGRATRYYLRRIEKPSLSMPMPPGNSRSAPSTVQSMSW